MCDPSVESGLLKMQTSLACTICLDLLNAPMTTKCGHTFCQGCLDRLLHGARNSPPCPLCMTVITKRSLKQNKKIINLVNAVREVISSIKKDCGLEEPNKAKPGEEIANYYPIQDFEAEDDCPIRRGTRKRAQVSLFDSENRPYNKKISLKKGNSSLALNKEAETTEIEIEVTSGTIESEGIYQKKNKKFSSLDLKLSTGAQCTETGSAPELVQNKSNEDVQDKVEQWLNKTHSAQFDANEDDSDMVKPMDVEMNGLEPTQAFGGSSKQLDKKDGWSQNFPENKTFDDDFVSQTTVVFKYEDLLPSLNGTSEGKKVTEEVKDDACSVMSEKENQVSTSHLISKTRSRKRILSEINKVNSDKNENSQVDFQCFSTKVILDENLLDRAKKKGQEILKSKMKTGSSLSEVSKSDIPKEKNKATYPNSKGHNIRFASEIKTKILSASKPFRTINNSKNKKSPGWSRVQSARKDLRSKYTSLDITGGEQKSSFSESKTESYSKSFEEFSQESVVVIDEERSQKTEASVVAKGHLKKAKSAVFGSRCKKANLPNKRSMSCSSLKKLKPSIDEPPMNNYSKPLRETGSAKPDSIADAPVEKNDLSSNLSINKLAKISPDNNDTRLNNVEVVHSEPQNCAGKVSQSNLDAKIYSRKDQSHNFTSEVETKCQDKAFDNFVKNPKVMLKSIPKGKLSSRRNLRSNHDQSCVDTIETEINSQVIDGHSNNKHFNHQDVQSQTRCIDSPKQELKLQLDHTCRQTVGPVNQNLLNTDLQPVSLHDAVYMPIEDAAVPFLLKGKLKMSPRINREHSTPGRREFCRHSLPCEVFKMMKEMMHYFSINSSRLSCYENEMNSVAERTSSNISMEQELDQVSQNIKENDEGSIVMMNDEGFGCHENEMNSVAERTSSNISREQELDQVSQNIKENDEGSIVPESTSSQQQQKVAVILPDEVPGTKLKLIGTTDYPLADLQDTLVLEKQTLASELESSIKDTVNHSLQGVDENSQKNLEGSFRAITQRPKVTRNRTICSQKHFDLVGFSDEEDIAIDNDLCCETKSLGPCIGSKSICNLSQKVNKIQLQNDILKPSFERKESCFFQKSQLSHLEMNISSQVSLASQMLFQCRGESQKNMPSSPEGMSAESPKKMPTSPERMSSESPKKMSSSPDGMSSESPINYKRVKRIQTLNISSSSSDDELTDLQPQKKMKMASESNSPPKMNNKIDSEEMRDFERYDENVWNYYNNKNKNNKDGTKINPSLEFALKKSPEKNKPVEDIQSDDDIIPCTDEVIKNIEADMDLIREIRSRDHNKSERDSQPPVFDLDSQSSIHSVSTINEMSASTRDLFNKCNMSLNLAHQILNKSEIIKPQKEQDKARAHSEEEDTVNVSLGSAFSTQSLVINTQHRNKVQCEVEALRNQIMALEEEMKKKEATLKKDESFSRSSKPSTFESSSSATTSKPEEKRDAGRDSDADSEELFKSYPLHVQATQSRVTTRKLLNSSVLGSGNKSEKRIVLICTGLSPSEVANVQTFAKTVAGPDAEMRGKWSQDTTHVVVRVDKSGTTERTLKYLLGVASGLWVVSLVWIEDSLRSNAIMPEEKYEALDCTGVPGPKRGRLISTKIFSDFQFLLIPPFDDLTQEQWHELITICGGTVVKRFNDKKRGIKLIVMNSDAEKDENKLIGLRKLDKVTVSQDWLIECIGMCALVSLGNYIIGSPSTREIASSSIPDSLIYETQELV